jgi:hypothetical protein
VLNKAGKEAKFRGRIDVSAEAFYIDNIDKLPDAFRQFDPTQELYSKLPTWQAQLVWPLTDFVSLDVQRAALWPASLMGQRLGNQFLAPGSAPFVAGMQILSALPFSTADELAVNRRSPAGGLYSMPSKGNQQVIDALRNTHQKSVSKSIYHNLTVKWSDDEKDGKVDITSWQFGSWKFPDK